MKRKDGRLRFLSIGIIFFALILIIRLWFVQVVMGKTFRAKADSQYVEGASFFDRGSIYFTAKDGTLIPGATIKTGYTLAINPKVLSQSSSTENVYQSLNSAYPVDRSLFKEKVSKTKDPYEELAKRLSNEDADKIESLSLPGVNLYGDEWRVYPGNNMAAHTLGFIGYGGESGTELAGRSGLERFYEPVLKRSSSDAFVNFFAEVFSDLQKTVSPGESLEGDVVTTIEPTVQAMLETDLQRVQDQYHSEFTGGVVIDPNTGEIYAMGLNPAFNPNNPGTVKDASVFTNKLVEDRYEMGSIVKALTMAAGLDSGAVTPQTTYNDPGCQTLNKKTFCNYDNQSHGYHLPMQIVLDKSLNTGAAFVEHQMGNNLFRKYMLEYGLGSTTGVDLPSEGKSLISNLSSPRDLEYAQASFGQGIALTPIQTVRALSAMANGGYVITPHLAKQINYKIGGSKTLTYPKSGPIFKPETSAAISKMLTEVVDTALKNGTVKLDKHSIAAKTGTAQIAKPNGGGYYPDHYLHSFFGYFPAYKPRFLIFLYTFYPKGVQYASETLTDSFIDMAKFLINYYDIPPDRDSPPPPTVHM
jgi:cell division protein FtsI/penicillin-binding protein 2